MFVVSLCLNVFCLPSSGILTWKYINHTYLFAVSKLNTLGTPYFFVFNLEKRNIYLL